jgi:hypothetical protein
MAAERLSMRQIREILRQKWGLGQSHRAVAGDGSEGIQAVFEARHRAGRPMAFAAFDLLELNGHGALSEPWTARRKRLEDLLETPPPGVCLVPITDDAPATTL